MWTTVVISISTAGAIVGLVVFVDEYFFSGRLRTWLLRRRGKQMPVISLTERALTIPQARPTRKALILAAGTSRRWQASIKLDHDTYYSTQFWKNVNEGLPEELRLHKPPANLGPHKALALLEGMPVINHAFLAFLESGVKDISVVASTASPAQKTILTYINFWNRNSKLRITPIEISYKSDVASSVFEGLWRFSGGEDIIVCYSDIIWRPELLQELTEQREGKIIVLVDSEWNNNYPAQRIWHDELYAELVFGKGGEIERIGEIVRRFENIPEWSAYDDRVEKFQPILEKDCIGEIVGLFKFSPEAREIYCSEYNKILRSGEPKIPLVEWKQPHAPRVEFGGGTGPVPIKEVPIREASMGCFLEYLSRQRRDLVKPLVVEDGWVEIDHWGDLRIAEEKVRTWGWDKR